MLTRTITVPVTDVVLHLTIEDAQAFAKLAENGNHTVPSSQVRDDLPAYARLVIDQTIRGAAEAVTDPDVWVLPVRQFDPTDQDPT
jgi:hypothetical protein